MDKQGTAREEERTGRDSGSVGVRKNEASIRARRTAGGGAGVDGQAGNSELHEAVGEIDGDGGEGDPSGLYAGGESRGGGESVGTAKRGVDAESGAAAGNAGRQEQKRQGESALAYAAERVANRRAARTG